MSRESGSTPQEKGDKTLQIDLITVKVSLICENRKFPLPKYEIFFSIEEESKQTKRS